MVATATNPLPMPMQRTLCQNYLTTKVDCVHVRVFNDGSKLLSLVRNRFLANQLLSFRTGERTW